MYNFGRVPSSIRADTPPPPPSGQRKMSAFAIFLVEQKKKVRLFWRPPRWLGCAATRGWSNHSCFEKKPCLVSKKDIPVSGIEKLLGILSTLLPHCESTVESTAAQPPSHVYFCVCSRLRMLQTTRSNAGNGNVSLVHFAGLTLLCDRAPFLLKLTLNFFSVEVRFRMTSGWTMIQTQAQRQTSFRTKCLLVNKSLD